MANRKELVLKETPSGCLIPTSHKMNQDGYFRKRLWFGGELVMMMYHRYVWQNKHGVTVPDGHEVDHMCRVRSCCNEDHLQLLTVSDHKVKTNVERSKDRIEEAYQTWRDEELTGVELAKKYSVTPDTGWRWIRMFQLRHTH